MTRIDGICKSYSLCISIRFLHEFHIEDPATHTHLLVLSHSKGSWKQNTPRALLHPLSSASSVILLAHRAEQDSTRAKTADHHVQISVIGIIPSTSTLNILASLGCLRRAVPSFPVIVTQSDIHYTPPFNPHTVLGRPV